MWHANVVAPKIQVSLKSYYNPGDSETCPNIERLASLFGITPEIEAYPSPWGSRNWELCHSGCEPQVGRPITRCKDKLLDAQIPRHLPSTRGRPDLAAAFTSTFANA